MRYLVDIKLTKVAFIPTWQKIGEATKHTVLGESYIDVKALPPSIQDKLLKIITKAYLQHLKEKHG